MKARGLTALIVALFLATSTDIGAQTSGPAISSVSGTVAHGSTITISGSGFGSKSAAAPFKYDDFQNLAIGQDLNANGWRTSGYHHPVASNARLRSGTPFTRNAHSFFEANIAFSVGGDVSNFYLTGLTNTKYYLDAWMYFTVESDPQPQNIKPIRFHQNNAGSPNLYMNFYDPTMSGSVAAGRDGVTRNDSDWFPNYPSGNFYNRWTHIQYAVDAGSNGIGTVKAYLNGTLLYNHVNVPVLSGGYPNWPELYIGNYVRSDPHGNTHAYWETVYFDTTWSRVEIGDNSAYNNCTHREIQIPTSWSSSSVSVRVNRGSFASSNLGSLYLFVVDANNNASPGFRLDGSTGGSITAPSSPTNLRIIR